eukprot:scaffold1189_cov315-Prasinococcus_capsulatus_cf.AAC.7
MLLLLLLLRRWWGVAPEGLLGGRRGRLARVGEAQVRARRPRGDALHVADRGAARAGGRRGVAGGAGGVRRLRALRGGAAG